LTSSTTKKVLITRFEREPLTGYVNFQSYLRATGVEMIQLDGTLRVLPLEEIKVIYFVREFPRTPGLPEPRVFANRPKTSGLWVRMEFRDGDVMDGLMANDLLQVSTQGYSMIPPGPSLNSQRIFVPRTALRALSVLGVVGSPLKKREKPPPGKQLEMFS